VAGGADPHGLAAGAEKTCDGPRLSGPGGCSQAQRARQSFGVDEDLYPPSGREQDRTARRQEGRAIFGALAEWAGQRLAQGYLPTIRGQLQGPIVMVTGTYRDYPRISPRNGRPVLNAEGEPVLQMRLSEKATWRDVWRFNRHLNELAYGKHCQRRRVGLEAFECVEPQHRGALHFHAAISGTTTEQHPKGVRYNDIKALWPHGLMKVERARDVKDVIDYVAKHVIGYVSTNKHGRSTWRFWGVHGSC